MAKIRGQGTLYNVAGSSKVWCQFYADGRRFRESTGTDNSREANAYLRSKLAQAENGSLVLHTSRLTVASIVESKLASDVVNGSDSYDTVIGRYNLHLKPLLGHLKATHLTKDTLFKYAETRQSQGAANATINREIALLKTSYNIAEIPFPKFKMLREPPARQGFMKDGEYQILFSACLAEGTYLAAMFEIAQSFGWRKESIQTMRVRQADFSSEEIRLDDSKNGEPVVAPMTRKIRELLAVCAAGKSQDDFLFTYPDGTPVKDFRKPWCRATMAAGVPDLLFHDLCRTGMRNMRRLGIDTDVAMKLAGRKTDSIFRRYNIVDSRDTREAVTKMDDYRHSSAIDGEALTVEVEMVQ
jgi:integrase